MSAYTSIKDVSKSLLGKLSYILTPIVIERFKNLDSITEVKCPVFILHGAKDKLIPPSHAYELKKACPTICKLVEPENMDHNEFDFTRDFISPFQEFVKLIDEAYRAEAEGLENVIQMGSQATQRIETEEEEEVKDPNDKFNMLSNPENFVTHFSSIDGTCVDYFKNSDLFEIFFDGALY